MVSRVVLLSIYLGLLSARACADDIDEIRSLFQSVLAEQDDERQSASTSLPNKLDIALRTATADQIQSLLPLAEKCLRSPKFRMRGYGVLFFTIITLRADSSKLLAPYADSLALLLDDSEVGFRSGAIYVLGRSKSAKALAYLADHLNDNNTAQQAGMIAAPLLESRDADNLHKVLNLVEQRPELELKGSVIQMLGFYKITEPEALKLIQSGLNDREASNRRTSLDAIGRMPKQVRNQFTPDLQRLSSLDPAPEIRSRAAQILTSSDP